MNPGNHWRSPHGQDRYGQFQDHHDQFQGHPRQFQDHPGQFQGHHDQFQGHPRQFQNHPGQFQDHHEQFQDHHDQFQGHSGQFQGHHGQFHHHQNNQYNDFSESRRGNQLMQQRGQHTGYRPFQGNRHNQEFQGNRHNQEFQGNRHSQEFQGSRCYNQEFHSHKNQGPGFLEDFNSPRQQCNSLLKSTPPRGLQIRSLCEDNHVDQKSPEQERRHRQHDDARGKKSWNRRHNIDHSPGSKSPQLSYMRNSPKSYQKSVKNKDQIHSKSSPKTRVKSNDPDSKLANNKQLSRSSQANDTKMKCSDETSQSYPSDHENIIETKIIVTLKTPDKCLKSTETESAYKANDVQKEKIENQNTCSSSDNVKIQVNKANKPGANGTNELKEDRGLSNDQVHRKDGLETENKHSNQRASGSLSDDSMINLEGAIKTHLLLESSYDDSNVLNESRKDSSLIIEKQSFDENKKISEEKRSSDDSNVLNESRKDSSLINEKQSFDENKKTSEEKRSSDDSNVLNESRKDSSSINEKLSFDENKKTSEEKRLSDDSNVLNESRKDSSSINEKQSVDENKKTSEEKRLSDDSNVLNESRKDTGLINEKQSVDENKKTSEKDISLITGAVISDIRSLKLTEKYIKLSTDTDVIVKVSDRKAESDSKYIDVNNETKAEMEHEESETIEDQINKAIRRQEDTHLSAKFNLKPVLVALTRCDISVGKENFSDESDESTKNDESPKKDTDDLKPNEVVQTSHEKGSGNDRLLTPCVESTKKENISVDSGEKSPNSISEGNAEDLLEFQKEIKCDKIDHAENLNPPEDMTVLSDEKDHDSEMNDDLSKLKDNTEGSGIERVNTDIPAHSNEDIQTEETECKDKIADMSHSYVAAERKESVAGAPVSDNAQTDEVQGNTEESARDTMETESAPSTPKAAHTTTKHTKERHSPTTFLDFADDLSEYDDEEDSDDDLLDTAPAFLESIKEITERRLPSTPERLNLSSSQGSDSQEFSADLQKITDASMPVLQKSKSKLTLDNLLQEHIDTFEHEQEMNTIKTELKADIEQGGFVNILNKAEEVGGDLSLADEQHKVLKLFDVKDSDILEDRPGEELLGTQPYQCLFDSSLLPAHCGFTVKGTSYLEKHLASVTPDQYERLLTTSVISMCFHRLPCQEAVVRWLLYLMSVETNPITCRGCQARLQEILHKHHGKIKCFPGVYDLISVLVNYGANLEDIIPKDLVSIEKVRSKLHSHPDYHIPSHQGNRDGVEVKGYRKKNLFLVLHILALAMYRQCVTMRGEELTLFVAVICKVSLDKSLENCCGVDAFQKCVAMAIKQYTDNDWLHYRAKLARILSSLTDHHHNMASIAELLPKTAGRVGHLQRTTGYLMLQKLLLDKTDQDFDIDNVQIRDLYQFVGPLKELLVDNPYKLSSVVMILDACVGINLNLNSQEREELKTLIELVNSVRARDNVSMLDRTRVKDKLVRLTSVWSLDIQTMRGKQTKIFEYTVKDSPVKMKIETLETSQVNEDAYSDSEPEDAKIPSKVPRLQPKKEDIS